MLKAKTLVVGHKNPDTDSICSAIAYAALKNEVEDGKFEARRVGEINEETAFVLEYFGEKVPPLIENVSTQVKDIEIRRVKGVDKQISLKKAWSTMRKEGVVTLPAVSEDGSLEGLITISDIAKSYMNIYDSRILSSACTSYANILETLEGTLVTGDADSHFKKGKVLIAAANPDLMENYIKKDDLVILGNRYESQLCAIEMGAACIVVCEGAGVSKTITKLAKENNTTVITTAYDTFTAARFINQSMPISYFMTSSNLITFEDSDFLYDIRDIMASMRHRDFPILGKNGKFLGMISRRNLLGAKGKRLILVDHNEKSQAVEGMEDANVVEIIDHHRLGTVETMGPVYFRSQPLGSTSTIIYQMYRERGVKISKNMAGLMCSAIISDTLLFRSPTCTEIDKEAALALADIAEIHIEEYAKRMFIEGSNLKNKTDEQIVEQDYKQFSIGKYTIAIGQISSLNAKELGMLRDRLIPVIRKKLEKGDEDMIFFMLTNILDQSTSLLCVGSGALQMASQCFFPGKSLESRENDGVLELPGVVSRKKQLVPCLSMGTQV